MAKIAIVIGISEYDAKEYNLPACKNDAENINKLLKHTKKYDEILYVTKDTTSSKIMDEIDKLVNKYKSKPIEELFFYFSGHGNYTNNEFFYITSNVNVLALNSTSISNTILDTSLRDLNPQLFVKVIDACHSGTSYVKEVISRETQKEIMDKTKSNFKNCYFLFSSTVNQTSLASEKISLFTKSIYSSLNKILERIDDLEIKYRDLTTTLSDYFIGNEDQTPYFVIQGPLSEVFFTRTNEIENHIKEFNVAYEKEEKIVSNEPSEDDFLKNLPSKEKATKMINLISEYILDSKPPASKLLSYDYDFQSEYISNLDMLSKKKIGEWIKDNKSTTLIFAKLIQDYESSTLDLISSIGGMYKALGYPRPSNTAKMITTGFESNVQKDQYCFKIETSSKKLLPKYCCQITTLFSLTKLYIFYSFYEALPKNWEEYENYNYSDSIELNVLSCNLLDEGNITDQLEILLNNYMDYIINRVEQFLKFIM